MPFAVSDHTAAAAHPPLGGHSLAHAVRLWWARRRAVRVAKRLGLRPDEGLQAMVERIEALRGQTVKVTVVPLPRTTTGLCCCTDDASIIVVNEAADPLHRVLITLHELWHLIEDLPDPGLWTRLWRRCITGPLERCGIRQPKEAASVFGDHSVFDLDNLTDVLDALPPELVQAVLAERRQVRMRGEHNHRLDPAEVFARQMLQMLALGEDADGTGSITSSLDHRRIGI
ncbi:hypothetical protein [Streptomyces sp. S.PNR 29]|uniref:hypothetical protein n=1 Tax=Streptomyces sp. S.PNR 29 TaxID=2973805 RepID=UPI0025B01EE9|nr:hypothetical protein [Streptomyces sp. S.PNR 29]MDN0195135.1 hypothetical protein [Streptomyces sp. S.PNR 29]